MDVHVQRAFPITYEMVARAYQQVKQGGKASGIDGESWAEFAQKGIEKQLYLIWNRMASGSYFPSSVKEVEIPKKNGKVRRLGIPTIRDRIAQQVVRHYMEQHIDQHFHENSYGYRPMKSSHEAVDEVRRNCLEIDWVIDLDISNFFDEINHELMLKAVEALVDDKWVVMYVKRWLEMKVEKNDGKQYIRDKGTPQGGVISPLLANLFLHFTLDLWLSKHYPTVQFVRYADDVIVHCRDRREAEQIMEAIARRLGEVGLKLNTTKSKIVYCQDYLRCEKHAHMQFDFLGFSFQPRAVQSKRQPGTCFTGFTPEISADNQRKIRNEVKNGVNWRDTTQEITDIANLLNHKIRGWINYFDRYGKRRLRQTLHSVDERLVTWLMHKHKERSRNRGRLLLLGYQTSLPNLFYHWQKRYCLNVPRLTRAV